MFSSLTTYGLIKNYCEYALNRCYKPYIIEKYQNPRKTGISVPEINDEFPTMHNQNDEFPIMRNKNNNTDIQFDPNPLKSIDAGLLAFFIILAIIGFTIYFFIMGIVPWVLNTRCNHGTTWVYVLIIFGFLFFPFINIIVLITIALQCSSHQSGGYKSILSKISKLNSK